MNTTYCYSSVLKDPYQCVFLAENQGLSTK